MARHKSKTKRYAPRQVAERGWDKFVSKIPQMITDYSNAMNRVANDPDSRASYILGVSTWTSVMRSPEVRSAIRSAVNTAKDRYISELEGMVVAQGGTLQATIPGG